MHSCARFATVVAAMLLFGLLPAPGQTKLSRSSHPRKAIAKPDDSGSVTGIINTYAGSGYFAGGFAGDGGYSGDGGPAILARINAPEGVALDAGDNLYIADTYNNVIRMVNQKTGIITTIAGGGKCSAISDYRYCGDGGPANSAELYGPAGVAVDASGNLYIADTLNNAIRRVDAKTQVITSVAGVQYCYATYECIGQAGSAGDGGPATSAKLDQPYAIAIDASGNLYIADTGNSSIREISATSGDINTIVGKDTGCMDETDSLGDGCPAIDAGIGSPEALAFDSSGNMYLSDNGGEQGLQRVRMVDAGTGIISTVVGGGDPCPWETDGLGDGCPATNAYLYDITGIAVDPSGNLYITSVGDENRVTEVDMSTGVMSDAVGQVLKGAGYSGNGCPAPLAYVDTPRGGAFDSLGNFYFADSLNNVVRQVSFEATPAAAQPTFSPKPGAYTFAQTVTLSSACNTTIYYTTDGSPPSTSSTVYSGPIRISSTTTLNAIAVGTGFTTSSVAQGTYDIQSVPTVTWNAPAQITYGAPLGAAQLNAKASVAGSFVYTPASGTILTAGSHQLSVTFTPTDGADYATVTTTTVIYVGRATPSISWTTPKAITYGTALGSAQLDATSKVAGSFTYYPAKGTVPNAGSTSLSVTFRATDTNDYNLVTVRTTLKVNPALLTITADNAKVVYGKPSPEFTYTASGFVHGDTKNVLYGYPDETSARKLTSPVGTYAISISRGSLGASNYAFKEFVPGKLTVTSLGTTATPTFSPAGKTYSDAQSVTISDKTPGATIYYTTNGSAPSTASTKYKSPIAVKGKETIKAIAVAPGYASSAVATASYTIQ